MPERAKTLCFIYGKLMNIILGPILFPQPEPLLLHSKTTKDSASLAFYMDDIYGAFKTYQKQYIFLHNHFFLHMV